MILSCSNLILLTQKPEDISVLPEKSLHFFELSTISLNFSKQGQIGRHGYSFVGVESLRNFDDFVI